MDLDRLVADLGRPHQGLVRTSDLLAAGCSASRLSRAVAQGRLVRHGRGVVGPVPLPPRPPHLVTAEGPHPNHVLAVRALLLGRPGTVATGRTAAVLRGWGLLVEPARPELAVEHGRRRGSRPAARQVRGLRALDHVVLPGTAPLPLRRPDDVVLEALARLPAVQAVVLVDSALRQGDVDLADLLATATALPGRAGAARARRLLALVDPLSGSVLESVTRVLLVQAGLLGFETQRTVRDALGRHVLRADFCWHDARVVLEVDGAPFHADVLRDRRTDNALAAAGYRVLRYTWADVVHEPERVLQQVREALAGQGRRAA